MSEKENEQKAPKPTVRFTKQQFLKSANFTQVEKYVLNAVLEDGKKYTLEEAKKLVENYKKKAVK